MLDLGLTLLRPEYQPSEVGDLIGEDAATIDGRRELTSAGRTVGTACYISDLGNPALAGGAGPTKLGFLVQILPYIEQSELYNAVNMGHYMSAQNPVWPTGGIHAATADGAVRFISDPIDFVVYRNLCTRSAGDSVDLF